jgi:hypothetical protein
MSAWYFNPGFFELYHCSTERPRSPKCIDDHANCVFCFRIETVFAVRAFDPAYGQRRDDNALLGPDLARFAHYVRPLTVLIVGDHS